MSKRFSFELVEGAVHPEKVRLSVAGEDAGSVVLFVGSVRGHVGDETVLRLEYEAWAERVGEVLEALAEESFTFLGIEFVELFGEDEVENGVAEEFKPLVVFKPLLLLVCDRGVGERNLQQFRVLESISDAFLQAFADGLEVLLPHGFVSADPAEHGGLLRFRVGLISA